MPRVAGIAVSIARRPRASVVILEGTFDAPTLVEAFDLTTAEGDTAGQAHDLASSLRNRLNGLGPERILIRRADFPPRPTNQEGPRLRLIVEGALAAAARDVVTDTTLLVGRDVAARTGLSKHVLDKRSEALVAGDSALAASAALAALA